MTSEQSRRMAPSGKLPLLLCALAPWPLLAATSQPSKSGSSVLGEPKVEAIEIIEVRGQPFRRELTLTRPGEALVTLEDIEEQQAGNFAEVLDTVPGITLDGGPRSGGEKINVWGFGETEDLNVYVDNAPVGFEQYRYGSFFIDPDMVKRIEVIKGAHDPRSGNGGFGGSMYVVTKSADDFLDYGKNLGARVKASYADNNGLETYTGTLYGRLNSGLSALVNYSYKDAGDLELGNGQVFRFSGYRQNNLLAKLDYELGAHKLSLSYTSYDDEGRKPWANRRGEMPTVSEFNIKKYGSFEAAEYANTALNSYKDSTVSLNYRYTPASPLWDLQLALSSSSNDRHWVRPQIAFDKMFVSVGNFGHESWLEYDRDFIDINNTSQLGDHLLTVGLQYRSLDRRSLVFNKSYQNKAEKNFGLYTPYYQPGGRQDTYAFYLSDSIALTDNLILKPSLRFDSIYSIGHGNLAPDYNDPSVGHDFSSTRHSGWSPRVGLEYRLGDVSFLTLDYAYSLQAPVVDEIYAVQYAKASSAQATSRGVDVERLHAYKLGLSSAFDGVFAGDDRLSTQLTLYWNQGKQDIAQRKGLWVDKSQPFESGYVNLDGYHIYGGDFEAQYRWHDWFADYTASYTRGKHSGSLRDSSGRDENLADIPPLNMRLHLGYYLTPELSLSWRGSWYDAQQKVPDEGLFVSDRPSQAYFLQDLYLGFQPEDMLQGLELRLALRNLTNQYYSPHLADGIAAQGRDIRLSLAYQF